MLSGRLQWAADLGNKRMQHYGREKFLHFRKRTEESHKKFSNDKRPPGWGSNPRPAEYEAGMAPRSVSIPLRQHTGT